MENAVLIAAGFLVPILVQHLSGWWLDSGRGVALTLLLLWGLAAVAALHRPSHAWRRAGRLCAGSITGSAAVLVWNGAGTIWPIVLGFAAALSAAATFGGAALVRGLKRV